MIKLKTATLVGQDHVKLNHNIYLQPRRKKKENTRK